MNIPENLQKEYDEHQLFLRGEGGRRLDWSKRYLRGVNLSWADLRDVNLSEADLRDVNMSGVNLSEADLTSTCLIGANLSGANLRRTNLSGSDLRATNLLWADLLECDLTDTYLQATGNMRELKSFHFDTWVVNIWKDVMQIGCERHKIEEWFAFSDAEIAEMDISALEWWEIWSPVLKSITERI